MMSDTLRSIRIDESLTGILADYLFDREIWDRMEYHLQRTINDETN